MVAEVPCPPSTALLADDPNRPPLALCPPAPLLVFLAPLGKALLPVGELIVPSLAPLLMFVLHVCLLECVVPIDCSSKPAR